MTPAFWLLHTGLTALTRAIIAAGRRAAHGVSRLRCWMRRRRQARILAVTDGRLLEDMGISPDVLREVFREPGALRDPRTGLPFPPTDRSARRHF